MSQHGFTLECTEDEGDSRFLLEPMTKYVVQLQKIEPIKMQNGDTYKWHFVTLTGKKFNDGTGTPESAKGLKLTHLTSTKLSPSTKLWKWCQNMLNRQLTVGEKINPAELVGSSPTTGLYVVIIEHHESKGKTYNRIQSIAKYIPKQNKK